MVGLAESTGESLGGKSFKLEKPPLSFLNVQTCFVTALIACRLCGEASKITSNIKAQSIERKPITRRLLRKSKPEPTQSSKVALVIIYEVVCSHEALL